MPPTPEPARDAPVLLSVRCPACRRARRGPGFKGSRPGRECPTGRCRRVWADGHGPDAEPPPKTWDRRGAV